MNAALEITGSPQIIDWLQELEIGLAFTTYQTCRLFLVGIKPDGRLSAFERMFDQAMGLYATQERLYLSTKYQLWQLDNVLELGQEHNGYDRVYVPRVSYTTGDLDIHDVVVDDTGRLVFVCTRLNCLATVSQRHSCTPLWQPPFISQLVLEDRCHLNGLAMVEGQPRYVTVVSQSDVVDGWRDRRGDGGCVVDVQSNEVILTGLSMPHSPRWYQGKLWLLNSGTGEFGYVDFGSATATVSLLKRGAFVPVAFCPGYLRGLAFWGDFAIMGLSKPRAGDHTFSGLALDDRLAAKGAEPRCGLMMIHLKTGTIVHWLRLEGLITELYDVQVLPQVQRPMALGFQSEEIRRLITLDQVGTLFPHPKSKISRIKRTNYGNT